MNAQRAEGDIHGSNDIALEFSASSDDIAMIKVAVLTYFENEHHRDQGFVIDDSDDPKRLVDYPGDPAYKPAWWTPQSLPDADVLWVRERGVNWLYIFSKQRGFLFYHLTSW